MVIKGVIFDFGRTLLIPSDNGTGFRLHNHSSSREGSGSLCTTCIKILDSDAMGEGVDTTQAEIDKDELRAAELIQTFRESSCVGLQSVDAEAFRTTYLHVVDKHRNEKKRQREEQKQKHNDLLRHKQNLSPCSSPSHPPISQNNDAFHSDNNNNNNKNPSIVQKDPNNLCSSVEDGIESKNNVSSFISRVKETLMLLGFSDPKESRMSYHPSVLESCCATVLKSTSLRSHTLVDGAIACLESLKKKGLRLALCTNSNEVEKQRSLVTHFGLDTFFDVILMSGEANVRKPQPEAMTKILKAWNLSPHEVVAVGDQIMKDVLCSHACGIVPIWIVSFSADVESNEKALLSMRADYRISALCQVESMLEVIEEGLQQLQDQARTSSACNHNHHIEKEFLEIKDENFWLKDINFNINSNNLNEGNKEAPKSLESNINHSAVLNADTHTNTILKALSRQEILHPDINENNSAGLTSVNFTAPSLTCLPPGYSSVPLPPCPLDLLNPRPVVCAIVMTSAKQQFLAKLGALRSRSSSLLRIETEDNRVEIVRQRGIVYVPLLPSMDHASQLLSLSVSPSVIFSKHLTASSTLICVLVLLDRMAKSKKELTNTKTVKPISDSSINSCKKENTADCYCSIPNCGCCFENKLLISSSSLTTTTIPKPPSTSYQISSSTTAPSSFFNDNNNNNNNNNNINDTINLCVSSSSELTYVSPIPPDPADISLTVYSPSINLLPNLLYAPPGFLSSLRAQILMSSRVILRYALIEALQLLSPEMQTAIKLPRLFYLPVLRCESVESMDYRVVQKILNLVETTFNNNSNLSEHSSIWPAPESLSELLPAPLIVKPVIASGSRNAHLFYVVWNKFELLNAILSVSKNVIAVYPHLLQTSKDSITTLQGIRALQIEEFIPHQGSMIKSFLIGDAVSFSRRASLPNPLRLRNEAARVTKSGIEVDSQGLGGLIHNRFAAARASACVDDNTDENILHADETRCLSNVSTSDDRARIEPPCPLFLYTSERETGCENENDSFMCTHGGYPKFDDAFRENNELTIDLRKSDILHNNNNNNNNINNEEEGIREKKELICVRSEPKIVPEISGVNSPGILSHLYAEKNLTLPSYLHPDIPICKLAYTVTRNIPRTPALSEILPLIGLDLIVDERDGLLVITDLNHFPNFHGVDNLDDLLSELVRNVAENDKVGNRKSIGEDEYIRDTLSAVRWTMESS